LRADYLTIPVARWRFSKPDLIIVEINGDPADNNAKLLRLLKDVPEAKRTARFHCTLALVQVKNLKSGIHDPKLFDGVCEGRIGYEPRGANGFGYDPLFMPDGFQQSFAELGDEIKNQLSHRAAALAKLCSWLESFAAQRPSQ